jgi:hypothetical protein
VEEMLKKEAARQMKEASGKLKPLGDPESLNSSVASDLQIGNLFAEDDVSDIKGDDSDSEFSEEEVQSYDFKSAWNQNNFVKKEIVMSKDALNSSFGSLEAEPKKV